MVSGLIHWISLQSKRMIGCQLYNRACLTLLRRDLTNRKNMVKQYTDKEAPNSINDWAYRTNTQSLTPLYLYSLRAKEWAWGWDTLIMLRTLCEDSNNVSDLTMTKPSRKVSHSGAAESLIWLLWCAWFGHDDAKSEGLLHGRASVFDLAMTKLIQQVFYSVATTSLIRPRWCQVGKSWSRPWHCLWFHHDVAETESVLLSRDDISDLAMTRLNRKFLELAATVFRTCQWQCWVGRSFTRSWWCLLFDHHEAKWKVFDSAATTSPIHP